MDFLELANKRFSVRAYKSDPVEEEKLQKVLEAARLAPTGANRQPFQLIVIHTKGREDEMSTIYARPFFSQAPLLICGCIVKPAAGAPGVDSPSFGHLDLGIVIDHLTLAATDLGLGTCWIAAFDRDAARDVLGIPENVEPRIFVTLGYSADPYRPKTRKPLNELVRYDKWNP